MKYEKIVELLDEKFKRYVGITKQTFQLMVQIVKDFEEKTKKKIGGPSKLSIENQVLLAMLYLREYRTQESLAITFGVSQQTAGRTIRKIEDILMKSGKFALSKLEDETVIIIDAMESPIERPKKNSENIIAGRKNNTLKKQK